MNRSLLLATAGLLFLTGCARHYTITLNGGERISTLGKPKLEHGYYHFKDASGREAEPISSGRVSEVSPTSMASPDQTLNFKNEQSR